MSETDNKAEGQKKKTSKFAIASMVLAFIGFCFTASAPFFEGGFVCGIYLAVLGVLSGIVSLMRIDESRDLLTGRGLAIAGITASVGGQILVFFVINPIIYVHVFGPIHRRLDSGLQLKKIGRVMKDYANDSNGYYPAVNKWCDVLIERKPWYSSHTGVNINASERRCYYAMNPDCKPNSPNDVVLMFETKKAGWNQYGGPRLLTSERHKEKGCNVLFNDGHVEFVKPGDIDKLKWKDEQNNE